jgi:hypothetical protein
VFLASALGFNNKWLSENLFYPLSTTVRMLKSEGGPEAALPKVSEQQIIWGKSQSATDPLLG